MWKFLTREVTGGKSLLCDKHGRSRSHFPEPPTHSPPGPILPTWATSFSCLIRFCLVLRSCSGIVNLNQCRREGI